MHTGTLTHADLLTRVCDLIQMRILAFGGAGGGGGEAADCLVVCSMIPEYVMWIEVSQHRQSCHL